MEEDICNMANKSWDFLFWNASGFKNFKEAFFNGDIPKCKLICIAETWLMALSDFRLCGYNQVMVPALKGKKGRAKGGMILYIKNEIFDGCKVIKIHNNYIIIDIGVIRNGDKHVIFFFFYFPPDLDLETIFQDIELVMADMRCEFSLIFSGDGNARIADRNEDHMEGSDYTSCLKRNLMDKVTNGRGSLIMDYINSRELIILNGRTTGDEMGNITFMNNNGKSVIDHTYVSQDLYRYVENFLVLNNHYAEHFPILTNMLLNSVYQKEDDLIIENDSKKIRWNIKEVESYRNGLNNVMLNMNDNEHMSSNLLLNDLVNSMLDMTKNLNMMVVSDPNRFNNKNNVWYDKECKDYKRQLGKQLKKFRKTNDQNDGKRYADNRVKYRKLCLDKKERYWNDLAYKIGSTTDSKEFWLLIKKVNYEYKVFNDIKESEWFDYYVKMYTCSSIHIEIKFPMAYDEVLDGEITEAELFKMVNKLKLGKAPGLDLIIPECIKYAPRSFLLKLLKLFNKIMTESEIPDNMCRLLTCPIYKKGDTNLLGNYRPITLVPVITKILGNILCCRLEKWITDRNLLHESQAGFRRNYSTTDNIFVLYSAIHLKLRRKRGKLYALFVDLSHAFDNIDHKLLWNKLGQIGLSYRFILLLKNYYEKAVTFIKTSKILQQPIDIQKGVLQGDPLSPTLFNVFLRDLPMSFDLMDVPGIQIGETRIHSLSYAEDLVVLADTPRNLQLKIDLLEQYFKNNDLRINMNKSKIIVFSNGNRSARRKFEWKWKATNETFEVVSKYVYLGVPITKNGNVGMIFKELKNKAILAMNKLWSIKYKIKSINFHSLNRLFNAIVLSVLSYAGSLWALEMNKEIESFQQYFYKKLFLSPRCTPGYLLRNELGIPPLKFVILKMTLKYWLKISQMDHSRLPRVCFKALLLSEERGTSVGISINWVTNLNKCLNELGYSFLCNSLNSELIMNTMSEVVQTYVSVSIQNDLNRIMLSGYNKYYRHIKKDILPASYLYDNVEMKYKVLVFNLRIHAGKMLYFQGVYFFFKDEICSFCNTGQVGSFFHMMTSCVFQGILVNNVSKNILSELLDEQNEEPFVYRMLRLLNIKLIFVIFSNLVKQYKVFNDTVILEI